MADGNRAGQATQQTGFGEIIAHKAKSAGRIKALGRIIGHNPAGLLATMLQGMQAQSGEICSLGNANNAKNAAFLF